MLALPFGGRTDMQNNRSRKRSGGLVAAIRRGVRKAALRRGIFIGRVTAPGAPDTPDAHLAFLLSTLGVNCVIDVGAHTGEFASHLRGLGYAGHIRSFEPVGEHFDKMTQRLSGDQRWRGYRMALGSEDKQANIHVTSSSTFTSFLSPSQYGEGVFETAMRPVREERVEIRRLEGMWNECVAEVENPVVFLKMDTQGLDFEVLSGTGRRLESVQAIQTELSLKPIYSGMTTGLTDSLGRLKELGFEPTSLVPVTRDPVDHLRLIEMDCVFIRSGISPLIA